MRTHTVKVVHLTDLVDALHLDGETRDNLVEYLDDRFTWGTSNFTLIANWEIQNAMSDFLREWAEENGEAMEMIFDEDQFRQQFETLVAYDVYINLEN